jgi:CubicO group peptidase (beta-lactamase class C family)
MRKNLILMHLSATYWPDFKGTDKGNIPIRDYLTHQARLPAWIPFWRMGLDKKVS